MSSMEPWLALLHIDQLGPVTFHKLLTHLHTPDEILGASAARLSQAGANNRVIQSIQSFNQTSIQKDLHWLQHDHHHVITLNNANYPTLLKQISDPPPVLFIHGDPKHVPHLLSEPQIAIVGSRNATSGGKQIANKFAEQLASSGIVINSGLASGIDGAAHKGSLQSRIGSTIAVTACGLDKVYPASHKQLANQISEKGLIVSEFPIGTPPKPGHFPRRNRIISGLSLGVLVVEASIKSGSLITARLAGEQGREIYAIPGSIHNPLSRGSHQLIRNGAKLVETVDDILVEIRHCIDLDHQSNIGQAQIQETDENPEHAQLLGIMGFEPISIDVLVEKSGLPAGEIASMLLILELKGSVVKNLNGTFSRTETALS